MQSTQLIEYAFFWLHILLLNFQRRWRKCDLVALVLVLLTVGQRQLICSYIHRFNVPLALGLATRHVLVCNPSKIVIDILRVILH